MNIPAGSRQRRADFLIHPAHKGRPSAGRIADNVRHGYRRRRLLCRLLPSGRLLGAGRRRFLHGNRRLRRRSLKLCLLPPLPLLLDLLVGDLIDHQGSRFNILVVAVVPVIPGTVGNGPDQAGHGNPHSSQQRQNHGQNADQQRQGSAAAPAQQIAHAAADDAAGGSCHAAIEHCFHVKIHAPGQRQVIHHTAQQGKGNAANAAHGHGHPFSEEVNSAGVEQRRNQKIQSRSAYQTQDARLHRKQQGSLRLEAYQSQQNAQSHAGKSRHNTCGNRVFILGLHLGRGLPVCRLLGRFFLGCFSGGRLPLGVRYNLLSLRSAFLLSHGEPPTQPDSE